jgi:hypothetical protein
MPTPLSLFRKLHRDEGGTAAVSFILCLPVFLTIVGIIVQFALMINAKMMVNNAAAAAARSAMTSLPEEHPENVKKAACFMLVPVSPKAAIASSQDARDYSQALKDLQADAPPTFPERYTYAENAVVVSYPNRDYKRLPGQEIEVTVSYKFFLTVPGAKGLFGWAGNIAGVEGRFWTVQSTVKVQTAHGRAARADSTGWAP